jgi:hypothetical protein
LRLASVVFVFNMSAIAIPPTLSSEFMDMLQREPHTSVMIALEFGQRRVDFQRLRDSNTLFQPGTSTADSSVRHTDRTMATCVLEADQLGVRLQHVGNSHSSLSAKQGPGHAEVSDA